MWLWKISTVERLPLTKRVYHNIFQIYVYREVSSVSIKYIYRGKFLDRLNILFIRRVRCLLFWLNKIPLFNIGFSDIYKGLIFLEGINPTE